MRFLAWSVTQLLCPLAETAAASLRGEYRKGLSPTLSQGSSVSGIKNQPRPSLRCIPHLSYRQLICLSFLAVVYAVIDNTSIWRIAFFFNTDCTDSRTESGTAGVPQPLTKPGRESGEVTGLPVSDAESSSCEMQCVVLLLRLIRDAPYWVQFLKEVLLHCRAVGTAVDSKNVV